MEVTQKATLRMSKYLASWGADRPFAHLIEAGNMANQIGETVSTRLLDITRQ
jgi:hypothetical protein